MRRWEDYEKLARLVAHRVKRLAPQAPVSVDDLVQEAWLTFARVCERYDPARGFQFSTYFGRAVWYDLLKTIGRRPSTVSLDEAAQDGRPLLDALASPGADPLRRLEEKELAEHMLARLSPDARRVLELTLAPPPAIEREFQAVVALKRQVDPAEAARFESVGIGWAFVMKVMRLSSRRRWRISREINRFKEAVHELEA